MLFNSIAFFGFLVVALAVYWLVPKRAGWQNAMLVMAGAAFYAFWDWRVLALFVGSVAVTYLAARSDRKGMSAVAIALLLAVLGVFKYCDFFLSSIGVDARLNWILPLGISFYTFMAVSYLFDVRSGKIMPEKNFTTFAAHMMFFPQIAAGPIGRADRMLPQYRETRFFDYPLAVEGCRQMLWGYFKKILVADTCAISVNQLLVPEQTSVIGLWVGAILYTVQIYADFSGYSDMAIGSGKLFGIRLVRNFSYPYFARNIADFWRRWHISLTSWFRDYVYIPLGGSRCSIGRKFANTMAVFLLSGLWHGANWTFVAWGALHGLFFVPVLLRGKNAKPLHWALAYPLTLLAVVVGWVFFFAPSIVVALSWVKCMFVPLDWNVHGLGLGFCAPAFAFGALMFVAEWLGRRYEVFTICSSKTIRWLFYISIVVGIFYFYPVTNSFIYFRF